jgi:hypothetical protein
MNKFTKKVCQYPKQLAWGHSHPVTSQVGRRANQGANLPKSVRRTTYAVIAATAILLLVISVPIVHPVAARSHGSSFGERHTTICGLGPTLLDGTGHPFLGAGLQAICSMKGDR